MATMELTVAEVALITRARQTPAERAADNAARQAAQEVFRLARMTEAERKAYLAREAAIEGMTPNQRTALQFLDLHATAEKGLARPEIADEVDSVAIIIDGLTPILQAKAKPVAEKPTPPTKKK